MLRESLIHVAKMTLLFMLLMVDLGANPEPVRIHIGGYFLKELCYVLEGNFSLT